MTQRELEQTTRVMTIERQTHGSCRRRPRARGRRLHGGPSRSHSVDVHQRRGRLRRHHENVTSEARVTPV